MKRKSYVMIFVAFSAGCQMGSKSADSLTGQYVRHDKALQVWDTLTLSKVQGEAENMIAVVNTSGTLYNDEKGKPLPIVHKIKKWTAVYDPAAHTLNIQDIGDLYSVDMTNGTLSNGKVTFARVK
jgi:hypothetical protein